MRSWGGGGVKAALEVKLSADPPTSCPRHTEPQVAPLGQASGLYRLLPSRGKILVPGPGRGHTVSLGPGACGR